MTRPEWRVRSDRACGEGRALNCAVVGSDKHEQSFTLLGRRPPTRVREFNN